MIICEKCGSENNYSTGTCYKCGGRIPISTAPVNTTGFGGNNNYNNGYSFNNQQNYGQSINATPYSVKPVEKTLVLNAIYCVLCWAGIGEKILRVLLSALNIFSAEDAEAFAVMAVIVGIQLVYVIGVGAYDFVMCKNLWKRSAKGVLMVTIKTIFNIVAYTLLCIGAVFFSSFVGDVLGMGEDAAMTLGVIGGFLMMFATAVSFVYNVGVLIYYRKMKKEFKN